MLKNAYSLFLLAKTGTGTSAKWSYAELPRSLSWYKHFDSLIGSSRPGLVPVPKLVSDQVSVGVITIKLTKK